MAKLTPVALQEKAFGSITNSYTAIGSAIDSSLRIIYFANNTDATLYVSYDGTNDHHKIAPSSGRAVDCVTNRTGDENVYASEAGTTFYVKYVSEPTSGEIVVEGYA